MSTEKKIWLLTAVFVGLFVLGLYNVYRPSAGPIKLVRGEMRELSPAVLVGPYPSGDELEILKTKGVEEVVSLMNSRTPAEVDLIGREREAAEGIGLRFSNYPMDFRELESAESRKEMSKVLAYVHFLNGKKVYVHCYLGKHRVGMFEREFLKGEKIKGVSKNQDF